MKGALPATTAYINEFIILSNWLESKGEYETDATKWHQFIVKQIVNEDYLVTKFILEWKSNLDFNISV